MKELIMVIMILAYLIFCAFIWYFRNRNNQDPGFIVWVVGWVVAIVAAILVKCTWGGLNQHDSTWEMIELIDKVGEDNESN